MATATTTPIRTREPWDWLARTGWGGAGRPESTGTALSVNTTRSPFLPRTPVVVSIAATGGANTR